jgi:NitT/TauT family transport system ATP-binding protein
MPKDGPLIALDEVSHTFASGVQALKGLSLSLRAGEFVSLLGPSGCGKSTVLRLVAGLEAASSGRVQAPALAATGPPRTAFVFQEPTLMPWAPVWRNVALPLRLQGQSLAQQRQQALAVLARVGLAEFAQAMPAQLSGGMKMRASIARALVTAPEVLLMDEPFAALDDLTRQHLNAELLSWWRSQRMAVLFVTHHVAEAVFLSQRVLVLSSRPGRVLADVAVPGPAERSAAWRHEPAFHTLCRELSAALEAA